MGVESKKLTKQQTEDWLLGQAIEDGLTGEFVDTEKFLKKLRNRYESKN